MNKREARAIGREIGESAASWVEYPDSVTLEQWEAGVQHRFACYDTHEHPIDWIVCEAIESEGNARQYADSPTYELAREPNSESLFDSYDEGVYQGALREARKRFKEYGGYKGMPREGVVQS